MSVAETSVQSVGISYRYCGDDAVAFEHGASAVSDRVSGRYGVFLQYGSLQRRDGSEGGVVTRVDAVKPQSQTAGVEMPLLEMLYAGGVADVA